MLTTSVLVFLTMIKRHHARFHMGFRTVALKSYLRHIGIMSFIVQQSAINC